jgi:hypothetical protein
VTAIRAAHLWCDHDECKGADSYGQRRDFSTIREARRAAQRDGWTYRNRKDFCPEHSGGES